MVQWLGALKSVTSNLISSGVLSLVNLVVRISELGWRLMAFQQGKAMKAPANLAEKLATFTDRFSPRTVATYNNNDIMVAKLEGPFHWHKHEDTDDFFLVLKGTLDIELQERTVTLNSGEVFVVPAGVEHRPVARGEVHILLIEPTGTPNTGDKATAAPRILA
jgi:mannose-6-phosphate isomerase-like protein (cupin superfamily)